jgi:archaetidylinositol phosphate synthase
MKISRSDFNARWSSLHGDVKVQGAISIWIFISYYIARVISLFRISPNFITFLGVVSSLAVLKVDSVAVIFLLILFSLICDGIDGSVAIYQNRVSKIGSLYDSIADRIAEAAWFAILAYLFVPVRYAIAIWVLGATQEYARARLASLGYSQIGVITPTERPMRAIFVFVVIYLYYMGYAVIPQVALAFTVLQVISVLMIVRMARSILR